jgi:hypothetical protein
MWHIHKHNPFARMDPDAKISAMTSASFTGPYHLTIKIFKLCRSLIQIMIIMIMMSSKMIMIAI